MTDEPTFKRFSAWNKNAVIALSFGTILLILSYAVLSEITLFHNVIQELSREIGFALIVAVIIWVTFEYVSQSETEEHWINRIEKISKNVFLGVFRRNLPEKFIEEATMIVLNHTFIRSDMHITYTLIDEQFTNRSGELQKFVRLNAIAKSKIKNISYQKAKLQILLGLPNPIIDEMKAVCNVHKVIIKQGGVDDVPDLKASEAKFREELKNDRKFRAIFEVKEIEILPEQEVEMIFDYSMAKEEEDTEIFQIGSPTKNISITVVDTVPNSRIVRAMAIHRCNLEDNSSAERRGTYCFILNEFFLPYQGFAIWWKKEPQARPMPKNAS